MGIATDAGLGAFIGRLNLLLENVFERIHDTVRDSEKSDAQNRMENECEIVVVGIDRTHAPIIEHIRRDASGSLVTSRKSCSPEAPLIIGDTESVAAARKLLDNIADSEMKPLDVLRRCIADKSVEYSGGTPCVIRFVPVGGKLPPYCYQQILMVDGTILAVPIGKQGGSNLAFRNIEYEISPENVISRIKPS